MASGMTIRPLRKDLEDFIDQRRLRSKWAKARALFEANIRHPSLNTELLEPRWRGIYSFRLDRKYRALFFIVGSTAEVFQITKHYRE